jgi:hypothetical protein
MRRRPNVGSPRICTEVVSGVFELGRFVAARLTGCGLLADDRFLAATGRLTLVRRFPADRRLDVARDFAAVRRFARLGGTRRLTVRDFFREERELADLFFFPLCHMLPRKTHSMTPAVIYLSHIIPIVHDVPPHSTKQSRQSWRAFRCSHFAITCSLIDGI